MTASIVFLVILCLIAWALGYALDPLMTREMERNFWWSMRDWDRDRFNRLWPDRRAELRRDGKSGAARIAYIRASWTANNP